MTLAETIEYKTHIIWDWNGTILDDVQHAVTTINKMLLQHDLPSLNIDKYRSLFEFPVKNYYDKLGFDYSVRSFEQLCHDFVDDYMLGVKACQPYSSIKTVLDSVKESSKTQSVLSASDQHSLNEVVDHYNFSEHFNFVFGIDNKFAHSKLDRGMELIELSGVGKKDTVLIGDTLHDLEVGDALGVDVVLVSHGHQCQEILKDGHSDGWVF